MTDTKAPYSIGRPHTWEKRHPLDATTGTEELDRAFEDADDYQDLLSMLADFANGGDAEVFREWTRNRVDNLREGRALAAEKARRGA